LHTLGADYPFAAVQAKVADEAKRQSVPTVDPLPAFAAADPQAYWVSPGDAHPNAKGQLVIAEKVYEQLRPLIESKLSQARGAPTEN